MKFRKIEEDSRVSLEYEFSVDESIGEAILKNDTDMDFLMDFIKLICGECLANHQLNPRVIATFMSHKVSFKKDKETFTATFKFDRLDGLIPQHISSAMDNKLKDFSIYHAKQVQESRKSYFPYGW